MLAEPVERYAISRLARLVHRPPSTERLFALLDLTSYHDDSGDGQMVFCVVGCLAPLAVWQRLQWRWQRVLDDPRIIGVGPDGAKRFHAVDIEHGHECFANIEKVSERQEIWSRFIAIAESLRIYTVATVIDVRAWNAARDCFVEFWGPDASPYFLAFQHQIQTMAAFVNDQPPCEKIQFIFDRQTGEERNADDVFHATRRDLLRFPDASRFSQTLSFGPSYEYPGLQVADMFAYEVKRVVQRMYGVKDDTQPRWQWDRLAVQRKGMVVVGRVGSSDLENVLATLDKATDNEEFRQRKAAWATEQAECQAKMETRYVGRAERARARTDPSAPEAPPREPPGEPA